MSEGDAAVMGLGEGGISRNAVVCCCCAKPEHEGDAAVMGLGEGGIKSLCARPFEFISLLRAAVPLTGPMFKGIFGNKPAKAPEGYVPPSIQHVEATVAADSSRNSNEQPKSDSSPSAFGFIAAAPVPETAASPSSAFSFISTGDTTGTAAPAVPSAQAPAAATFLNQTVSAASPASSSSSSGFSFIQDGAAGQPAAPASGFSFMQDSTPASGGSAEVDPKILEENMRVAGMKKVVKKRTMARKPGQAAHDDDETPPNSSQKPIQPAIVDVAKTPNSAVYSNQGGAPIANGTSSLPNEVRSEKPHTEEEPAFSFMTRAAASDSHAQPPALPSSASVPSGNAVNALAGIQDDGDSENSDGGGLDLDGMIIHEVSPLVLAPPLHQPQLQHQSLPSGLQHWIEMKDDASGKMCVCCVLGC